MEEQTRQEKINKQYAANLQIAQYSSFKDIEELDVFKYVGKDTKGHPTFYWLGLHQPTDKKLLDRLKIYISFKMHKYATVEPYTLIYFNTRLSSYGYISELFQFYRHVPTEYLQNLNSLYILNPSVIVRGYTWWTKKQKILKEKMFYIEDLNELQQLEFFTEQFYNEIPEWVRKSNKSQGLIEGKRGVVYDKDKADIAKEGNQQEQSIIGRNLENFELSQQGVPLVLEKLAAYFQKNETRLQVQGIFRKTGFASEQKVLEDRLSKREFECLEEEQDPLVVAATIKKILYQMPEPIFPYEAYNKFLQLDALSQSDQIALIKDVIKHLPEVSQLTLYFLTQFFKLITRHVQYNLMDEFNVSTVFAPCLLRPQHSSWLDVAKQGNMIKVIAYLQNSSDEIFDEFQRSDNSSESCESREQNLSQNKSQKKQESQQQALEKQIPVLQHQQSSNGLQLQEIMQFSTSSAQNQDESDKRNSQGKRTSNSFGNENMQARLSQEEQKRYSKESV